MTRPACLAVMCVALASAAACVKTQARTPTAPPALATPAPPPRVHVPVNIEPPPAAPETPTDPVAPPPARTETTPPRPAAPPPATTPPPTAPPVPEPMPERVLQPVPNVGELERRARQLIDDAERDLKSVEGLIKTLSPGAREQYYSAIGFVRRAHDALASKNFLYATQLADKAATLARLLLKQK